MHKINILGFSYEELKTEFLSHGFSILDAKRTFPWIHKKCVSSFDCMSDLPTLTRYNLKQYFTIERPECVSLQKSNDGTQKALLKFQNDIFVETVFIPDEKRNTVCVSSQAGCAMGCKFCHTGTQSFIRNLTSSEIIAQILFWKDNFNITNIVFMGMGEPLLNYQNLESTIKLLLDEKTHNFSRNKITVSTCGVISADLERLASLGVRLAISLHAPNDNLRSTLMPINKRYDIHAILKAAKKYLIDSNTSHVTFEYVLLHNINDCDSHAKELAKLLHGINCRVNLISYNNWPNAPFVGSSTERMHSFLRILLSKGIRSIIRKSRGNDILAACGQLKGENATSRS